MERSVKVDYLGFTTRRCIADVLCLFAYLPNPLVFTDKGMFGYTHSYQSSDGVSVLFSPGRNDINVQMSGRGCDCELDTLIDLVVTPADVVSRLDIALDCMDSGVTCDDIWRLLQRGEYLGDGKVMQINGLLPEDGHTIYVGSRKGDRYLRIYDKGAESKTGTDWLRFEVQLRHSSANQFFLKGVKSPDFFKNACSLLNHRLRLINPGQEGKRAGHSADCILTPFWSELTDSARPFRLQIPKTEKTVQSTLRYVRNAAASLKALRGAMLDYDDFIHDAVESAVLKPSHVAIQDQLLSVNDSSETSSSYHFDALQSLLVGPALASNYLDSPEIVGSSEEYLIALCSSGYVPVSR